MEQLIVGWFAGTTGYDILFWSVIILGLSVSLYFEWNRWRKSH